MELLMNKYITALSFVFLTVAISYPMEHIDKSIIPNSSYMIYEDEQTMTGGVPASSRQVTFYTPTGDPIKTIEHHFCFYAMNRKLDQSAPKPQPIAYQIKYWPAISLGWGMTKGVPGDFIAFYDKNGNEIKRYRYDKTNNQITVFSETENTRNTRTYDFKSESELRMLKEFPLDLSIVNQAP